MRNDSVESAIREWDGQSVVVNYDPPTDAWIFIAIHSTRLGPAGGGTRMKTYTSPAAALQDALRLAAAMTRKFAVPALPYGGGKAVVNVPANFDPSLRQGLLRRYGAMVKSLGGLYLTGPDVGTRDVDMDTVAETGAPYVFGKSVANGGRGDSGAITAVGVLAGCEIVCESLFGSSSLRNRTVLVQGAGKVGGPLIRKLCAAGAKVLFNDVDAAAAERVGQAPNLKFVPTDSVYDTPCDLFVPCALGGLLDDQTIPRLRCRAVAGAANNQLADSAAADCLQARGILYAPDYVVNVGGAMGLLGMETQGWSPQRAEREVTASVHAALRKVFSLARTKGCSTEAAAEELAGRNLTAVAPGTLADVHRIKAVKLRPGT